MAASIGDSKPYSGEVRPGGPPDVRELAGLVITKVAVDPQMSNNGYLLRCRATDDSGTTQTAQRRPPAPDGATGHHTIRVQVRA